MENPVDHTIDLGLVNYVQHPSNPQYIVYRFADKNRADSFKRELVNQKIWFEENTEPKRSKEYTLFGIHKGDFKKTESINYRVEAKHKKPFIPFKILRYSLMLFSAIVLTLSIMGYCNRQKILDRVNNNIHLINDAEVLE